MNFYSIESGSKVFDWTVPPEWEINDAYIITPDNKKICDFKQNNLHVLNYSTAINQTISLEELQNHLYSLENVPKAIPYVSSYYKKRWGFCIAHEERLKLKNGNYKVFIDASHNEKGVLNYADLVIKSTKKTKDEILISTYLCHPSMANNELSGPVLAIFLAKWLKSLKHRKYNYRFVFVPETIGSIVYINKHFKALKKNVKAGFVLSCLGDDLAYSLIQSPSEKTLADKVAFHTMKDKANFKTYSFLHRGSDERQYCSALVDLPVVCLCRSKFGSYKEYHTSLDNLEFISEQGLLNSLLMLEELVLNLELNAVYENTIMCEAQLGKRGLYHDLSTINDIPLACNFLAYCNSSRDLIDIANILNLQAYSLEELLEKLLKFKLLKLCVN